MKILSKAIDFMDRISVRTTKKVLLHMIVGIVLGIIIGFIYRNLDGVKQDDFLLYVVMLSTISGVLLASSVTISFFSVSNFKNDREKNMDRLERLRGISRKMIEKEVKCHPEMANRLSNMFGKIDGFTYGQKIEMDDVIKMRDEFSLWVKECTGSEVHPIVFSDKSVLDSFWLHLRDSIQVVWNIYEVFMRLDLGYKKGKVLRVSKPLILTWVLIEVLLISSVVVGILASLSSNVSLAVIVASAYLFLTASFAMTRDILAIINIESIPEAGLEEIWEMAQIELGKIKIHEVKEN